MKQAILTVELKEEFIVMPTSSEEDLYFSSKNKDLRKKFWEAPFVLQKYRHKVKLS